MHTLSGTVVVASFSLLAQGCGDDDGVITAFDSSVDAGADAAVGASSGTGANTDESVLVPATDSAANSTSDGGAEVQLDAGTDSSSFDADVGDADVTGVDASGDAADADTVDVSAGPVNQGPSFPHEVGSAGAGQDVFRFGTFGNEGFWTDAARLPQGIVAAGLTPVQALQAGLSVNVEALDEATLAAIGAELESDGTEGPLLNDPATTIALLQANAVVGVVFKDANDDGILDLDAGDKIGVSCALCHGITDGSVVPNALGGGSIGIEVDGPTPHNLNVGAILAMADNSRAFYPLLQVNLEANGNQSLGRAPFEGGITEASTEAEVDAYLSNPNYYPIGTFDDAPDGNGAPQQIVPFFRTDLSAPFGTPGDIATLDNFNNLVYTALLDPTTLLTPAGRDFLMALGGQAAGQELADDYEAILVETGVINLNDAGVGLSAPFVTASLPVGVLAGSEAAPVGLRVDEQALRDLNAYTDSLAAPSAPDDLDILLVAQGERLFRENCTTCHNVDQSVAVPSFVVAMDALFPAYDPVAIAFRPIELPFRPVEFANIQDDPSTIFDDKTVVVEASRRGEVRGSALPLLLDLARKPQFLHDGSVNGLDMLVDPARGVGAPHPFYIDDAVERSAVVEFLKSLDTSN